MKNYIVPLEPTRTAMIACQNCSNSSVTPECTIDAIVALQPLNANVLNAYGIDTCCGGRTTLGEATQQARVPISVVLEAIAVGNVTGVAQDETDNASSCSCGCRSH